MCVCVCLFCSVLFRIVLFCWLMRFIYANKLYAALSWNAQFPYSKCISLLFDDSKNINRNPAARFLQNILITIFPFAFSLSTAINMQTPNRDNF